MICKWLRKLMGSIFPGPFGTTAKNARLLNNQGITRRPTNDKEWSGFIQELNKWIRNEEGTFSPSFTGFSTDPLNSASLPIDGDYTIYGKMVFLQFDFDIAGIGTSDAVTFSIDNVPTDIQPAVLQQGIVGFGHDNSATLAGPIMWRLHNKGSGSAGLLNFFIQSTASNGISAWTASGTKGFVQKIHISYSLWDATL